jgi:hypothetical protein
MVAVLKSISGFSVSKLAKFSIFLATFLKAQAIFIGQSSPKMQIQPFWLIFSWILHFHFDKQLDRYALGLFKVSKVVW